MEETYNPNLASSFITLDEVLAEKDTASLYVVNNTANIFKNPTTVVFSVANHPTAVVIPITFIPIDIGLQVNKKILLDSSEFLGPVNKQLIKIARTDLAKKYLATANAQREAQRLLRETIERGNPIDEHNITDGNNSEIRDIVRNIIEDRDASDERKILRLQAFQLTDAEKQFAKGLKIVLD